LCYIEEGIFNINLSIEYLSFIEINYLNEGKMKLTIKIIIILLGSKFIIGCAATHMAVERKLNDNEGVFITKLHTNKKGYDLLFYEKNGLSPKARVRTESLESIHVIPVAGSKTYFLGMFMSGNCSSDLENRFFDVKPGTITYIGDIYVYWNTDSWLCGTLQLRLADNEKETISEVKEQYPLLFNNYKYEKNIPVVKIKTVEGFEEVEELKQMKEKKKAADEKQIEQKGN